MPFTAEELANIGNAALDFYIKDKPFAQTIQKRPFLDKLMKGQKSFPGGKENISISVKGEYVTTTQGFSHDDTVTYVNPAKAKRVVYPWKEIHAGIMMTLTELKVDGISVVDSSDSAKTTAHSDREMTALHSILDDKLEDMAEGWARGQNAMFWGDGTADPKKVPGVRSFVTTTPTVGVTGGLDRAANSWWRNRASLAVASNSGTWAAMPLMRVLQREVRQLRRYGGDPKCFPCGSDFLSALEDELRSNGSFTQQGWAKNGGKIDVSVADVEFKGVELFYDPTLDDDGYSKYGYWLDLRDITPRVMEGEDMKQHTPARPADKYVMYRAMTWTGGLTVRRLNSSGVYSIA